MIGLSSEAGSARHRLEALPFATAMEPGLRALAVDLHSRLVCRRIVQRASQHHGYARHDLCLPQHAGAAVRTEPPEHRFSAIAGVLISLQLALHRHRVCRRRHDGLKARPGVTLAIAAMAETGEHWIAGHCVTDA